MPLDQQQVAPGNRIKYSDQESDVVDRVSGASGNRYLLLANPDNPLAGLRVVSESVVMDDDNSEFVSTTAEAKDPERAKQAEADAQREKDLAEFDQNRADFVKWQESQRTPVQTEPTGPTGPTNN